ncbi:hypothetical protein ANN_10907 [Periplaneta americana]|uniref:Voltage-dependent calcium channel alpha-2/delta subunit conserved region domain-containing protein n=1 Tax=Periplaneta americana TaxID=6978 RepID=A0ABQ8T3J9_PERAM|nr:hypothetical protein ANN_10907 [Periplaneta americana]
MLMLFFESEGPLLCHFMVREESVTSARYSEILHTELCRAIKNKQPGCLREGDIMLHDNALPHTAQHIMDLRWEVLEHPPYSLDLSPCDFQIFASSKVIWEVVGLRQTVMIDCQKTFMNKETRETYQGIWSRIGISCDTKWTNTMADFPGFSRNEVIFTTVKLTGFLEFGKDATTLPPCGFDGNLSILLNEGYDWLLTGEDKVSVTVRKTFICDNQLVGGSRSDFKETHIRTIEEVWYQRAVESQVRDKNTVIYSVPFSYEQDDSSNALVTASYAILSEDRKVPLAVAGFLFQHQKLLNEFHDTTSPKCSGCISCSSDEIECYILDNNGYIVASETSSDTGKFFGEVEGSVMNLLIKEKVFKKISIIDYQAICLREDEAENRAPFLTAVSD